LNFPKAEASEVARILKVAEGAPYLIVERRAWGGDAPVTQVPMTCPGEAHGLVARFTPV
jgi:GntR family histidine utilization transcriptional repressor